MRIFKNMTMGMASLPEPLDLEKISDIVAAGGSGRSFFGGGGYPPYYNDGYYGWPMGPTSIGEVIAGLVILGVIFFVVYLIFAIFGSIQHRMYYGKRRKRDIAGEQSDLDILLGSSSFAGNLEPWRNGHPMMRMLKNNADAAEMDMTAKILGAIEKKSLDYE